MPRDYEFHLERLEYVLQRTSNLASPLDNAAKGLSFTLHGDPADYWSYSIAYLFYRYKRDNKTKG
jgi:hypothetical protein